MLRVAKLTDLEKLKSDVRVFYMKAANIGLTEEEAVTATAVRYSLTTEFVEEVLTEDA